MRPFDEAQVRAWFAVHLDQQGRYFVAVDGRDRILGISLVKVEPVIGFEVMGLGIAHDAKRRGIGRSLLAHCERVATREGYRAVRVSVFADNAAMLCLLLTAGYLPIRLDAHVRADLTDMLVLHKRLG